MRVKVGFRPCVLETAPSLHRADGLYRARDSLTAQAPTNRRRDGV